MDRKTVRLEQSFGRISADYIYLYPPDIPIVTPGEMLTDEMIGILSYYIKQGLSVKGIWTADDGKTMINVVDDHRSV
jgi:arginine/lysine/ornithine decarboxylase